MERIKCFLVEKTEAGWRNVETGEVTERVPPGGMYYVDQKWAESVGWLGPDGKCLHVQTPAGAWYVDSRASNCTLPDDKSHRCWIRHGDPPNVTVDKNGLTCGAGSGSIQCGTYHGFLRNGYLESC